MTDGGKKFCATDIYGLLFAKYRDDRQWLCATEVGNQTGFASRRLDFVAVNCYASSGYGVHAFEVKISKSDLRRELTDPSKHNIFFEDIDTYSIVAPDYVLDSEYIPLIPKNWGIYTAVAGTPDKLKTVRKPLYLHDEKDRGIGRAFAFGLIRSLRNANTDSIEIKKLCEAEYQRGIIVGQKVQSGTDWHARYVDEHERVELLSGILNGLGIHSWSIQSKESAKRCTEDFRNRMLRNEAAANFLRDAEWEGRQLARIAAQYEETIKPLRKGYEELEGRHDENGT